MGKSSKAKKSKQLEKNKLSLKAGGKKLKFKAGKTLKKAQNETRTDFKARKIIIGKQLEEKDGETLVTKRQHSLKELLTRLSHHSAQVRRDGVMGIHELIKTHELSVFTPHMSTLLKGITPMILDTDSNNRGAGVKCIEALIVKMGPSVQPYFGVLCTYLTCAMAHLNIGVQADSLKLVNVLLVHTPALVAQNAASLLENFVNLISRKSTISGSLSNAKTPVMDATRVLHTSPDSTLGQHKFHLELLRHLGTFLEAIVAEQKRAVTETPLTMWQTVMMGSIPPVSYDNSGYTTTNKTWLFTEQEKLQNFTTAITSILFDVWAEVDPHTSANAAVSGKVIGTLECVMKVAKQMWSISKISAQEDSTQLQSFKTNFKKKFTEQLMAGFPYVMKPPPQKQKERQQRQGADGKQEPNISDNNQHRDLVNISLAQFAVELCPPKVKERVMSYLTDLLQDGSRDGQYTLATVVELVLELMQDPQQAKIGQTQTGQATKEVQAKSKKGQTQTGQATKQVQVKSKKGQTQTGQATKQVQARSDQFVDGLLESSFQCYKRLHPLKKDRAALLQILLVATDLDHMHLWDLDTTNAWVKLVVDDLARGEVSEAVLQMAINLRLRGNTRIREHLQEKHQLIRDSLSSKGIKNMSKEQIEARLRFLIKDCM